ncbi:MAG: outer membrane beta-barrel protein [Chitinophagales bacterium]|nr:outer membrane beta-barrel protein [Chitinophagales bacterium]
MKPHITIMLVLLCSAVAYCQPVADSTANAAFKSDKAPAPVANIKLNLLTLLDPIRTSLAVSADLYLHERVGLELGGGYIFSNWFQSYKGEKLYGFRGRLGVKYFLNPDDETVPYFGIEGKLNWYHKKQWEQICRYGCQYNETFVTTKRIVTGGIAFKAGSLFYINKKRNVFFDLYGGVGYKLTHINYLLPDDAELLRNRSWLMGINRFTGTYHLPDFLLGLNIGYAFYRKN